MIVMQDDYRPPLFLRHTMAQTIYPALFRKVTPIALQRERIPTPDSDFLDLDWHIQKNTDRLVVLTHGLEGDSQRPYMMGMAKIFMQAGFSVLSWNFRSCSGSINKQKIFYHSGATYDLNTVLTHARKNTQFQHIALVGFSLGGNLITKFLGESAQNHDRIKAAVAISVPIHLSRSCDEIAKTKNSLYELRFLRSLKTKVKAKAKHLPGVFDLDKLSQVNSVRGFDDAFTAPIHGFKDAEDYYTQNSSIHFIDQIKIPTLMINAENDTFLSNDSTQFRSKNKQFQLLVTKAGGHCGFPMFRAENYWSEQRALQFVLSKL